ncbi:hypothetical protein A3K78_05855 [Candidatus Bathyarchaeota archaeon RBG_13_52_12]|nr:MAG: hypothetical protein A3K78_05855 [Candidatus Bathyarchaeota archaeon RBG_13_52_12]
MKGIEMHIKMKIRSTIIQIPLLINWFAMELLSINFPEEIPNKVVTSSPNTPINSINELALNIIEYLVPIRIIYFFDE